MKTITDEMNEWCVQLQELMSQAGQSPECLSMARHLAAGVMLAAGNPIREARLVFAQAFKDNPDFRRVYVDNIACVIMDFENAHFDPNPELSMIPMSHEVRNQLADKILKHMLE